MKEEGWKGREGKEKKRRKEARDAGSEEDPSEVALGGHTESQSLSLSLSVPYSVYHFSLSYLTSSPHIPFQAPISHITSLLPTILLSCNLLPHLFFYARTSRRNTAAQRELSKQPPPDESQSHKSPTSPPIVPDLRATPRQVTTPISTQCFNTRSRMRRKPFRDLFTPIRHRHHRRALRGTNRVVLVLRDWTIRRSQHWPHWQPIVLPRS